MSAPSWRYVTEGEQKLARSMFGTAIELPRVRIFCQPFVTDPFTPGSWGIVWPSDRGLQDFAAGEINGQQSDFIHEMTHVWQAQNGANLAVEKVKVLNAGNEYDYDSDLPKEERAKRRVFPETRFATLNIEQKARFIEHAFLANHDVIRRHTPDYFAPHRHHWYEA